MVRPLKIGDRILKQHGLLIYEAKILRADYGEGVAKTMEDAPNDVDPSVCSYFVHYLGWHKKWDEWVTHENVMQMTPANLEKQKQAKLDAKKMPKTDLSKKKKISASGADSGNVRQSPFKRMKIRDEEVEAIPTTGYDTEETGMQDRVNGAKSLALQMPFALKKVLVEDWKRITQQPQQLIPLPRTPNAKTVISDYLEDRKSKLKAGDEAAQKEFNDTVGLMESVESYFDRALGLILLYRFERSQYNSIKEQNNEKRMSEIYGAEHLLRLFVRLPVLLGTTSANPKDVSRIQSRLLDFLKFLQKKQSIVFAAEYEMSTESYTNESEPNTAKPMET